MRSNFLGVSSSSGQQEVLLGTVHCRTQGCGGAGLVLVPLCHSCLKWYHHLLPIYTSVNPPFFLPATAVSL